MALLGNQRTDVRVVELYGRDTRHKVLAEFRDVDKAEAVRLVRAVVSYGAPPDYGPRPTRWVQPAAQCKVDGRWHWVGRRTAEAMGVFPKGAVV